MEDDDEARPVPPDGRAVRRLRHERGWSPKDLIAAIANASHKATGIPETITPSQLAGIEERNEVVSYAMMCLVSSGLDCNPVELLLDLHVRGKEAEGT